MGVCGVEAWRCAGVVGGENGSNISVGESGSPDDILDNLLYTVSHITHTHTHIIHLHSAR